MINILVVEPDHEIRVYLRKLLENAGHTVSSTTNATGAFELLERGAAPAIILLSSHISFPGADIFLSQLKKNTQYKSIPVGQLAFEDDLRLPGTACIIKKNDRADSILAALETCLS